MQEMYKTMIKKMKQILVGFRMNFMDIISSFLWGCMCMLMFNLRNSFNFSFAKNIMSKNFCLKMDISSNIILILIILICYVVLLFSGYFSRWSLFEIFGMYMLLCFNILATPYTIKLIVCTFFFSRISYKLIKNFHQNKGSEIFSFIQLIIPYVGILFK